MTETPSLFNWLVLLVWHECLRWQERCARPWPALAGLVLLMAGWARLNGETLAGFIVLAAYCGGAAGEFLWAGNAQERQIAQAKTLRLCGAGILCVGAAGLPVGGYHPLCEKIRLLLLDLPRNWPGGYGTIDFQSVAARGILVWLAAVFLFLVWQRPRLTPAAALVLVSWIGLACYAQRYIPFLVILTVPILAECVGWRRGWGWGVLAGAVLVAGLPRPAGPTPVQAMRFIQAQPAEFGGRIFMHHTWIEYLAQEWPGRPGLIAGADSIRVYRPIANLETNWVERLERSEVVWTVLPRRHCLNQGLQELATWRCAYSDEVAVVYRRGR